MMTLAEARAINAIAGSLHRSCCVYGAPDGITALAKDIRLMTHDALCGLESVQAAKEQT